MYKQPGYSVPDESFGYESVLDRDPSGFWRLFRGKKLGGTVLTALGTSTAFAAVSAVVFEQEAQAGSIPTCEMTSDGFNAMWWVTQDGVNYGPIGPLVFFPAGIELEPGVYYDGVTYEASARCGGSPATTTTTEAPATTTTTEAPTTTEPPATTEAPVPTTEAPATTTSTLSPEEKAAIKAMRELRNYIRNGGTFIADQNQVLPTWEEMNDIFNLNNQTESTSESIPSSTVTETTAAVQSSTEERPAIVAAANKSDGDDDGEGMNLFIPLTALGIATAAGVSSAGVYYLRNRKKSKTPLPPINPTSTGSPAS